MHPSKCNSSKTRPERPQGIAPTARHLNRQPGLLPIVFQAPALPALYAPAPAAKAAARGEGAAHARAIACIPRLLLRQLLLLPDLGDAWRAAAQRRLQRHLLRPGTGGRGVCRRARGVQAGAGCSSRRVAVGRLAAAWRALPRETQQLEKEFLHAAFAAASVRFSSTPAPFPHARPLRAFRHTHRSAPQPVNSRQTTP